MSLSEQAMTRDEIARLIWFVFGDDISIRSAQSTANDAHWNHWRDEEPAKTAFVVADYILSRFAAARAEGVAQQPGHIIDGKRFSLHAGERYRHVKRGSTYTLPFGRAEAMVQCEEPISDEHTLLIYIGDDGMIFARPTHEFFDGRFQPAPRQDGSAERDGGAGVPDRLLSVREADKSDRAEGVAALQQAAATSCFECGHDLNGPYCPACNPALQQAGELFAENAKKSEQAGEPVALELGAFKSWTGGADVVSYIARYGGMCRGCADEHGICPGSGLPCDDVEKPIRHVLEALSYGLRHGYITLPQQTALVEQGGDSDA